MLAYEIRIAQPGDLDGIYHVFGLVEKIHRIAHPEIFKEADHPADIKRYLLDGIRSADARIFVAVYQGKIIGAVIAWISQTRDVPLMIQHTYLSINDLVVAEEFRQQGIGQALMDCIHQWAKEREIDQIQLTVWDFNQEAQDFYHKLGYEMLHHRMRKELL